MVVEVPDIPLVKKVAPRECPKGYWWWKGKCVRRAEFEEYPEQFVVPVKIADELYTTFPIHVVDFEDPFLIKPPEEGKYKYVIQAHIRGRSVHLDDRKQRAKDWATGKTRFIPKGLSKAPETFEEAKRLYYKEIHPVVEKKLKDPLLKLLSGKKATVPIEWLTVEGKVEKGMVGATRYEYGYFIIIDKGEVEYLTLKPYFHEFFYHGKLLNGIYVDRLIENRAEWKRTGEGLMSWMFFATKPGKLPYVITKRAVDKKWLPPKNHSALPRHIRKKIPSELRFWKYPDRKDQLRVRAELRELIKRKEIKFQAPKEITYSYGIQTWKKQVVIRIGPTRRQYHLWLDLPGVKGLRYFVLENDIAKMASAGLYLSWPNKEPLEIEGDIKPKTKLNPTKDTPSTITLYDKKQRATVLEYTPSFMRIRFKGKYLDGLYTLIKEMPKDPKSRMWTIERTKLPEAKIELSKLPPYLDLTGVLFRYGKLKGLNITKEAVKNAKLVPFEGRTLVYQDLYHGKDELSRVGILKDIWWDEDYEWVCPETGKKYKGALMYKSVVTDERTINSILNAGLIWNSAEISYVENPKTGKVEEPILIRGAALTYTPACKECVIKEACSPESCVKLNK